MNTHPEVNVRSVLLAEDSPKDIELTLAALEAQYLANQSTIGMPLVDTRISTAPPYVHLEIARPTARSPHQN